MAGGFQFIKVKMKQPDFIIIPTQLLGDDRLQALDRELFGYIYWMTKLALMKCVAGNKLLAELTHASQRGVANSLNRLEKQGYISRIYQDESNRVRVEIVCNLAFNTNVTSNDDTLHQMMKPLHEMMKHVTSNDEQNKNNIIRKYNKNSTKVLAKAEKPIKRSPEIDELFKYWLDTTGLAINSRIKQNRFACSNLLRKYGLDGVRRLIDGVAQAQNDKYAPRVADFSQLQAKLNELLLWGKQQTNVKRGVKI